MNSELSHAFRMRFSHPHAVLPVIHVSSESQALRNTELAQDCGADGVFLINHSISSRQLLEIHACAATKYPDFWLGVNCLDRSPQDVFSVISPKVDGVWSDTAAILETRQNQPEAQAVLFARKRRQCLYFGGVAFKYQRAVVALLSAARIAAQYMDVITTSGPGTGKAAHVDKIRVMKTAVGDFPLAIASGITPENVGNFLPWSDCYLVATGISRGFEAPITYERETVAPG
jgi:uncharacterized protein